MRLYNPRLRDMVRRLRYDLQLAKTLPYLYGPSPLPLLAQPMVIWFPDASAGRILPPLKAGRREHLCPPAYCTSAAVLCVVLSRLRVDIVGGLAYDLELPELPANKVIFWYRHRCHPFNFFLRPNGEAVVCLQKTVLMDIPFFCKQHTGRWTGLKRVYIDIPLSFPWRLRNYFSEDDILSVIFVQLCCRGAPAETSGGRFEGKERSDAVRETVGYADHTKCASFPYALAVSAQKNVNLGRKRSKNKALQGVAVATRPQKLP